MRRVGPPALGEVVDLHGEGLAQLGVRRPGGAQLRLGRPGPGGGGGDEVTQVTAWSVRGVEVVVVLVGLRVEVWRKVAHLVAVE